MRIRIIFRPDPPFPKDTFLFNDVFVPRQSKGFPLFASAVVHALALALIPALVQALSSYDPPPEHKTYHLEMMHLRLPDRVYLPPAKVHPVESAKRRPRTCQCFGAVALRGGGGSGAVHFDIVGPIGIAGGTPRLGSCPGDPSAGCTGVS